MLELAWQYESVNESVVLTQRGQLLKSILYPSRTVEASVGEWTPLVSQAISDASAPLALRTQAAAVCPLSLCTCLLR